MRVVYTETSEPPPLAPLPPTCSAAGEGPEVGMAYFSLIGSPQIRRLQLETPRPAPL
jgi:hypothetical protein